MHSWKPCSFSKKNHTTGVGNLQQQLTACGLPALTVPGLASLTPFSIRETTASHWANTWRAQLNDGVNIPNDADVSHYHESQRTIYASIHPTFTPTCQPYLTNPSIPLQHRAITARFRCGNHWLAEHTSRYIRAAERKRFHNTPCCHCGIHTWSEPNRILMCDACDACWHCRCLQPPLPRPPRGNWYCPSCLASGPCAPLALQAAAARISKAMQCPHCGKTPDNTQHFLFDCPHYISLRQRFSGLFQAGVQSTTQFLLQPNIKDISQFLFSCYKHHISPPQTVP
jgi:hypothetical protein